MTSTRRPGSQPRADIAEACRNCRRIDENGNYFGKHAAAAAAAAAGFPSPRYSSAADGACPQSWRTEIANIGESLCFDDFIERQKASVACSGGLIDATLCHSAGALSEASVRPSVRLTVPRSCSSKW